MCLSLWSSRWYKLERILTKCNTHSPLALGVHHKTNRGCLSPTHVVKSKCWHAASPVACRFLSTCFWFPICSTGRAILAPCLKLCESCKWEVLDNEAAVFIMQILYTYGQGTVVLRCSNLEHHPRLRIPDWFNSDGWLNLKHLKTQPKP